jgi:DNA-binding GntR family transcriptional regulator
MRTGVAIVDGNKLVRSTTAVDVARVLKARILAGHYAEDQFIRQELIAQELGVSRIPVREALAQLEAEGLVVREKFRGAVVPKLSLTEIEEIYALRAMLEPHLLRAAMANMTAEKVEQLRHIVQRSRDAQDMADWAGFNLDFHRTLYEVAAKPLAMQVLDNLLMRADRYLKMQRFLSVQTQEESDAEHQRILDHITARDTEAAVAALCQHIQWNAEDVRKAIGFPDPEAKAAE